MRATRKLVVAATIVVGFLSGCGGGLSEQDRTDFVAGCVSTGSSQSQCECMLEFLEGEGVTSPEDLTPELQTEAATSCAGA